jgi:hypothetical protein
VPEEILPTATAMNCIVKDASSNNTPQVSTTLAHSALCQGLADLNPTPQSPPHCEHAAQRPHHSPAEHGSNIMLQATTCGTNMRSPKLPSTDI